MSEETSQQSSLSDDLLREIYNLVNDAIFIYAVEPGEIIHMNETMREMFKYSRAEARQLTIEDISTGDYPYTQETAVEYMQKAAEGDPQAFDWHATDSEGEPFWAEVSIRRASIDDQTLVLAILQEIKDSKHRAHELNELFEEYKAIFENAQDAIFLINVDNAESDPVFRFERLSPSHESTSGLLTENIRGKTPREALGDETGAEVEANYRRCVNAREPITYEEELPMPERRIFWQTKLAPVIVDDQVIRIVGIARDITDRKEREREIQQEQARFRAVFEDSMDAMVIADDDGRYVEVNESATDMFGVSEDELLGRSIAEFAPEDFGFAEAWQEFQESEKERGTFPLVRADGDERIVDFAAIRDIVPGKHLSILRDVTDRKERERRYNAIFNQTYQFTGLMEPDGTVLEANETALEFGDLDREEVVDEKLWDAYWFQDSDGTSEQVRDAVRRAADGEFVRLDLPVQGADEELVIDFSIRPITDEDGEVTLLIPEGLDITDRKEREHELRRFRQAADSAGHGVYFTDRDGIIEYVNPAFESITGYSANEAVGNRPRILKSGEMSDDFYEDLWSTLMDGNVWEGEVIDQQKNGEQYTAYQTIAPIKADGKIDGFVGIQTDISDRKALESDLKTSLTQLEVIDRVLRHNLHNDMNVIKGNAEIIQATTESDVAERAEIIIGESEKLLTTVGKEREIIDALVDAPSPEPIDLGAVIESTVAATREQYPEAHITVEGAADRQVRAINSINRALTELLTNAVNHSDQTKPSIEMTVEDRDDVVAVRIADDGPGIPEMERKILTEDAEIESLIHGSGLGLWLVKMIVEKSGGSLAFDETEPRGSIVTIKLPTAPVQNDEE